MSQMQHKLQSVAMHGGIVRAAKGEDSNPGRRYLYKWRPQPNKKPAHETKGTDLARYLHDLELY